MYDLRQMLKHCMVLIVMAVFWAAVSRMVGYSLGSYGLSATGATLGNALYTAGLLNAALYPVVVTARTHRSTHPRFLFFAVQEY